MSVTPWLSLFSMYRRILSTPLLCRFYKGQCSLLAHIRETLDLLRYCRRQVFPLQSFCAHGISRRANLQNLMSARKLAWVADDQVFGSIPWQCDCSLLTDSCSQWSWLWTTISSRWMFDGFHCKYLPASIVIHDFKQLAMATNESGMFNAREALVLPLGTRLSLCSW